MNLRGLLKRVRARDGDGLSRASAALAARGVAPMDFFGGWLEQDVELLSKYSVESPSMKGTITDFLGVRTAVADLPWSAQHSGMVFGEIAIPDDGVHAEAIEYVALLTAIDTAAPDRFSMLEIGASYAPWLGIAGTVCSRLGKPEIRLSGVEASSLLFPRMQEHLALNNIHDKANGVHLDLRHGAISTKAEPMYFPIVGSLADNGGQAVSVPGNVDYRGASLEHEAVQGIVLSDLLATGETVDFIHLDVQGAEAGIIEKNVDLLSRSVRYLFVGTHSRLIEGQILEAMFQSQWELMRERPTTFTFDQSRPSVTGMTTKDGGQLWRNRAFD